jgi:hypothetical protein
MANVAFLATLKHRVIHRIIELTGAEKTTSHSQPPPFGDWLIAFDELSKNKTNRECKTHRSVTFQVAILFSFPNSCLGTPLFEALLHESRSQRRACQSN